MPAEKIPSTSDGIETTVRKNWTPNGGEEIVTIKTGRKTDVDALYATAKSSFNPTSTVTRLTNSTARGRNTFEQVDVRIPDATNIYSFNDVDGLQELLAIDVVRPIYAAPYFNTLTYDEIAAVRVSVENGDTTVTAAWSDLQDTLFRHIVMGRAKYYETAYVFRRTFRASAGEVLKKKTNENNTVVTLPKLAATIQALIDTLPDGEWLKRPTQVRYLGREGWDISEEYLWSPAWSVVYGGTFDGT